MPPIGAAQMCVAKKKSRSSRLRGPASHSLYVFEYATLLVARREDSAPLSDPGEIVDVALMFPTAQHEAFLHKIMVRPAMRSGGIGTRLMRAALELATAPVLLTVDPANSAAVHLYQNFGFQVREEIKGYYRLHEDRYLMAYSG